MITDVDIERENDLVKRLERVAKQYDATVAVVKEHQKVQGIYHHSDGLPSMVRSVLNEYNDIARTALSTSKEFRDRMMINLRAMSLVLSMVSNASSHREKDARLRGCIEIVEKAIDTLAKEQFDIAMCQQPRFDYIFDPFRSDFPTRHFVDKIRELESELESLRTPVKQEPQTGTPDVSAPF